MSHLQCVCNGIIKHCRLACQHTQTKTLQKRDEVNERHCWYCTLVKDLKLVHWKALTWAIFSRMPESARVTQDSEPGTDVQTGTRSLSPIDWVPKNRVYSSGSLSVKLSSFSKEEFDLGAGFLIIVPYRNLFSKASGNCHCWRQVLS